MTSSHKKSPKAVFVQLRLTYTDRLFFQKSSLEKRCKDSWKKTKDPTKKFLFYCYEKEIKERTHPKVYLRKKKNGKEYGVFLDEVSLGKHAYVGEYTGIVRKETVKTFLSSYSAIYPTPFSSFRNYVIDANRSGNFTRFIKHANDPNVEMKSVLSPEGLRMVFLTKRPVKQHDELKIHYGTWLGKLLQGVW